MFPDFVGAKDVRQRWELLLTGGGKDNRSGARSSEAPRQLTAQRSGANQKLCRLLSFLREGIEVQ